MEPETPQKWYRQTGHIVSITIAGVFIIFVLTGGNNSIAPAVQPQLQGANVNQVQSPTSQPRVQEVKLQPKSAASLQAEPQPSSDLSNDNYYTNVNGNKIHSPAYSDNMPAGASAKCRDGTFSFSQNRRGTCSHHGGVATWY